MRRIFQPVTILFWCCCRWRMQRLGFLSLPAAGCGWPPLGAAVDGGLFCGVLFAAAEASCKDRSNGKACCAVVAAPGDCSHFPDHCDSNGSAWPLDHDRVAGRRSRAAVAVAQAGIVAAASVVAGGTGARSLLANWAEYFCVHNCYFQCAVCHLSCGYCGLRFFCMDCCQGCAGEAGRECALERDCGWRGDCYECADYDCGVPGNSLLLVEPGPRRPGVEGFSSARNVCAIYLLGVDDAVWSGAARQRILEEVSLSAVAGAGVDCRKHWQGVSGGHEPVEPGISHPQLSGAGSAAARS